jgi:UMF1 family MFS transporter
MTDWVENVAAPAAESPVEPSLRPGRLSRSAIAWALHQGGRDPYVILITIYVFAPYFATTVVGDPVRGQALLAFANSIAGWIVAFTAPLLGALVDRLGPRKPGLALFTGLMVLPIAALWWALPGGAGLSPALIVTLIVVVGVLFPYSEVHHNAMLPYAATRQEGPGASGLALSAGNGVSVLVLLFVLWAFALPGKVDWSFVPAAPLFGLDPALNEPDRIVAPIAAALMALSLIPILLWSRDAPRVSMGLGEALRGSASQLWSTLKLLPRHRDPAIFLVSRALYADGKLAILIFGGVFAAGVMRWGVLEMLAYGVLLSTFAVFGGFMGGALDRKLGPKRAVQIELVGALIAMVMTLGGGRERILYVDIAPEALRPIWNGPLFTTWPEIVYLASGFLTAVCISACYASSRTLLVRLAPREHMGGFFGLYALSGAATAWLGPTLVGIFTASFSSQRAGFIPIAGLLLAGLIGLLFVKGGGRDDAAA